MLFYGCLEFFGMLMEGIVVFMVDGCFLLVNCSV